MKTTDRIITDAYLEQCRPWAALKVDEVCDLLESRGWTKGGYDSTGAGPQCVQGAVAEVTEAEIKDDERHHPNLCYYTLRETLWVALGLELNHLPTWNDRHRSGASVVRKLRKVARDLRKAA